MRLKVKTWKTKSTVKKQEEKIPLTHTNKRKQQNWRRKTLRDQKRDYPTKNIQIIEKVVSWVTNCYFPLRLKIAAPKCNIIHLKLDIHKFTPKLSFI